MDKQDFKKTGEELQEYLRFRRRGSKVEPKKGKGSYSRKQKHKEDLRDQRSRLAHLPYKQEVSGSNPLFRTKEPRSWYICIALYGILVKKKL